MAASEQFAAPIEARISAAAVPGTGSGVLAGFDEQIKALFVAAPAPTLVADMFFPAMLPRYWNAGAAKEVPQAPRNWKPPAISQLAPTFGLKVSPKSLYLS